ncbi:unnamed protein product [Alternaria alternata]
MSLDAHTRYALVPSPQNNLVSDPSDEILEDIEDMLLYPNYKLRESLLATVTYPIFWVNAKSKEDIEMSYELLAKRVDIHPRIETVSEFLYYLTWQIETDWIMVFDGLQRQTAFHLAIKHRLPQGLKGRILFTVEDKTCLELFQPLKSLSVPKSEWLEITRWSPSFPNISSHEIPNTRKAQALDLDQSRTQFSGESTVVELKESLGSISDTGKEEQQPYTRLVDDASSLVVRTYDPNYTSIVNSGASISSPRWPTSELGNDPKTGHNDAKLELEQLGDLLSPVGGQELQIRILDSLQRTFNMQGRDQEFLPNGALYRLINTETVVQVLIKDLSHSHTSGSIRQLAGRVCSESLVIHRGKEKIKTFRKIFALLVIVECTSLISSFLEEDVSDLDLPLSSLKSKARSGLCRIDASGKPSNTLLQCFQPPKWSPIKLRNFQEYQWKLLAPFFAQDDDGDVKHYALHDHHIIPFIPPDDAEEEDMYRTGGFGKVFMVRIHSDHHNFRDKRLCHRGFAVKQQLHENNREAFKKEIVILKSFSGERSHKHIVSLLATYEQFRKFHLVFYRAEGDLFTYWKEIHPRPVLNRHSATWIAEQCAGIAEALLRLHRHMTSEYQADTIEEAPHPETEDVDGRTNEHVYAINPFIDGRQSSENFDQPAGPILEYPEPLRVNASRSLPSHNNDTGVEAPKRTWKPFDFDQTATNTEEMTHKKMFGRHGDINPSNILWYDDSDATHDDLKGTLKLADFGQAELNTLLSRTQPRDVVHTITYGPPEIDLHPHIVRQSFDIWGLGCVYLELVTWILGGSSLLESFAKERLTEDIFMNNILTDKFFELTRDEETLEAKVTIKKAVTSFIHKLHQNASCTNYLHDLLNMIEFDMIVVDSAERASCVDIWRQLKRRHDDCLRDESYASDKNPWSFNRGPTPQSSGLKFVPPTEGAIGEHFRTLHVPLAQQRIVSTDTEE